MSRDAPARATAVPAQGAATPEPRAPARDERYAVIGHPVEHSQSPFIHAEFARQTGEPVRYERVLCPLDGFAGAVTAFAASGALGCNVTLPFKFAAFELAAEPTPRARQAGACNTLRFGAGGWHGDNTDGAGLVRDIEGNAGVELRGARLLLIGAGGGAAGALGALIGAGASDIVVANRTVARARALVERHAAAARESGARLRATALLECGAAFDVVVNASASSVSGAGAPVSATALRRGGLAVDMMYGAAARGFVAWAEANGARGRDGLGMLVEQAAESFFFWRALRPHTRDVLAELRHRVDAA